MTAKQAAAQRVYHALRRRAPRAARVARGALQRAGFGAGPLVSVVLPVCDNEDAFVQAALESLVTQQHGRLEVLVLPHGVCSRSLAVARRVAADDPRIRIHDVISDDVGAARNRGAALARGAYLSFASASDTVPPAALRVLVAALEESGSDFCVGRVSERSPGEQAVAARRLWHPPARRTTIEAVPHLVTNTHPGSRLFRTAFWRASGLSFGTARARGEHSPVVEAYLESTAFDVVEEVTYRDLRRGDGTAIGHVSNPMKELDSWFGLQQDTLAVLEERHLTQVRDEWLVFALQHQATPYVESVEGADEGQWQALREHLGTLVERGGTQVWSRLGAYARLRTWLVQQDLRAELVELLASRWYENGNLRTDLEAGPEGPTIAACFDFPGMAAVQIPDDCVAVADWETPLQASLRSVHWRADDTVDVELFVWIDFLDEQGEIPELTATLVDRNGEVAMKLPAEQRRDPRVNVVARQRYQDHSGGAVTLRVDVATLVGSLPPVSHDDRDDLEPDDRPAWSLRLRARSRGVSREGTVTAVDHRGSAAGLGTPSLAARTVGTRRVTLARDHEVGVRFVVDDPPDVVLVSAEVHGRRVTGELAGSRPPRSLGFFRSEGGVAEVRCPVRVVGGRQTFVVDLPSVGFAQGGTAARNWWVRGITTDRRTVPVGWAGPPTGWLGASAEGELAVSDSSSGTCVLAETVRTLVLDDVVLAQDSLRVRARWLGAPPDQWRVELRSRRATVSAPGVAADPEGGIELVLPLTWTQWGLPQAPVPPGTYRIVVLVGPGPDPVVSVPLVGPQLRGRLLDERLGRTFRMRLNRPGRELNVVLEAPLADDEKGSYAQALLRTSYADPTTYPIDDRAVYLECYGGSSATDSQLAVAEELVRTRPDLDLFWGVASWSATVPAGVTPLLVGSREWHRVRSTAKYLVNNIDFERSFAKRPGQLYLQTFHGYPSKSMGIRMWEGKQFTPRRIRAELDRTSRDWDLILTPAPEMDQYYRREYAYDGPILNQGYPRDDALLSPQAEAIRWRTREILGVAAHQRVVLYAPTWRDNLAMNWRSVETVSHLDIESASAVLGDDYVFLMRGHRFHNRSADLESDGPRLVDVTSYPEVNDLILAADVAVLDYSSMRFDLALTGRPMIFLVPDLGEYDGRVRGFLYPFEETAPGPLLETPEQVVDRLRDLEALTDEYAKAYARFNARFNQFQDGRSAERVVAAFFGPAPLDSVPDDPAPA